MLLTCVLVFSVQAQNSRTLNGNIVDVSGEPLIGASVKVLGATVGTITDIDGNFTISIPEKGKIEVSYMGFKTQVISDFTNTRIVLQDDPMQLDDVVVVGYATQKKAHLTGAISTINPSDIQDLSSANLASSLAGLVPGLSVSGGDARPGTTTRLVVRDADVKTSFTNVSGFVPDPSPLYVIDGFTSTEQAFNNLDPTMVESISVLKDGAAAVYGAASANGVILVTTKKGKLGKPVISYNGQFGFADEVARPKMLSAYEYGKIWNGVRGANVQSDVWNNANDLFQSDELKAMKSLNYDLLDQYWSSATTQKHSVNVSGATELANYYGGVSYFTQDGNLGDLDYERWNYRAGVDLKISKWIKASLQLSGDYGKTTKPYSKIGSENAETDYNILLSRPRYIPEYVNGLPIAAYAISNSKTDDSQYYHYQTIQDLGNYSQSKPQNMTLNTSFEYDFGWSKTLSGLKLKFTYSKAIGTSESNQYASDYNLYQMISRGGSGSHLYTGDNLNLDPTNFATIKVENGNFLRRSMNRADNYQMNFIVSYEKRIGDHNISGLFTIERSESENETLEGSVASPYSFTNGQSNSATGAQTTAFGRTESGLLSYVGRLNYAYLDRYLIEFLIRSDASTNFAPENYWGTFPSLSAGWIMSEENWFRDNVNFIDYLKLRASLGLLGKDNTKPWCWMQTYGLEKDKGPIFGTATNTNAGTHISIPDEYPNYYAHWDKSYKSNIGIDASILNNRLGFTLDGYYEWNREIFVTRSSDIPGTVGARASAENYGEIDLWGIEFSATWKEKIGKDFKYSIGLNTGYSDDKVIKMPWDPLIPLNEQHPGQRSDLGTWGLQCMGMFRSYQEIEEYFDKYKVTDYLGMTKDKVRPGMLIYKDIRSKQNGDGTYGGPDGIVDRNSDLVKVSNRGNIYGLTANLKAEWKGFSINAQISGSWGGYSYIPQTARSIRSLISTSTGYNVMQSTNLPSFWADNMFVYHDIYDASGNVVAEANLDAKYPNLNFAINGYESTFWKVSAARATLRNVTIAYSLPKEIIKVLGIESCRLNLTGQNLLSLYNPYPDNFIDPLAGSYGSYPVLRKFTLGVNVTF